MLHDPLPDGRIDTLLAPDPPWAVLAGDALIERVFPDFEQVGRDWHRRTGQPAEPALARRLDGPDPRHLGARPLALRRSHDPPRDRGESATTILDQTFAGFATALEYKNLLFRLPGRPDRPGGGALPGLGPSAGMALLLPLTFGRAPVTAGMMPAGIMSGAQ